MCRTLGHWLLCSILLLIVDSVAHAAIMDQFTIPDAKRVLKVSSNKKLGWALKKAKAGDHILIEDGVYEYLWLRGLEGSKDDPIVIKAANAGAVTFSGSKAGRNALVMDSKHVIISGLRFSEAELWAMSIGPAYHGDPHSEGSSSILIYDCEFDHAGQSLLKINGNSSHIDVVASRFHHSGMNTAKNRPYAEGIYIGEGGTLSDRSHKIRILENRFYHIGNDHNWGEAIDIKGKVYNILVEGNHIENVTVDSGGAITALIDLVDYPTEARNPEIVIRNNQIHSVRKQPEGWHGAGICVGANGILLEGNHVSGTEGPALLALARAGNTLDSLRLGKNFFEGQVSVNDQWRGKVGGELNVSYMHTVSEGVE